MDLAILAAEELVEDVIALSGKLDDFRGHTSAQMTERYSHFFDGHIADLGVRLHDRLFGGSDES